MSFKHDQVLACEGLKSQTKRLKIVLHVEAGEWQKCSHFLFGVLLMKLTVHKNADMWNFLTSMIGIDNFIVQKTIMLYVRAVESKTYQQIVKKKKRYFTMEQIQQKR